jgi:nitroreductase
VIKDKDIKKAIGAATLWADWVADAPVIFACCCDISWDIGEKSDEDYGVVGNTLRYCKEVVDFLRSHENRKACKKLTLATPTYIAAQQMILAAVSHGLRGCLVDFIDIEKINNILGLPDNITCQLLVPIGYAGENPCKKQTLDDNHRIFTDKWQKRS